MLKKNENKKEKSVRALALHQQLVGQVVNGLEITGVSDTYHKDMVSTNFKYMGYTTQYPQKDNKKIMIYAMDNDTLSDINKINKVIVDYNETRKLVPSSSGQMYERFGKDYIRIFILIDNSHHIIKNNITSLDRLYFTIEEIINLRDELDITIEEERNNINSVIDVDLSKLPFDVSKCRIAKNKVYDNDSIRKLFTEEIAIKENIGKCAYLFELHNATNPYAFYQKLYTYAQTNKNLLICERGLYKDEIVELTERFYRRCVDILGTSNPISKEDAFYSLLYRMVLVPVDGFNAEIDYMSMCIYKQIGESKKVDAVFDREYGVDVLFTEKDGNGNVIKNHHIQIKPVGHIKGTVWASKNVEKLNNYYHKALNEKNIVIEYAFYFLDDNGKYHWLINPKNNLYLFSNSEVNQWEKIDTKNLECVIK